MTKISLKIIKTEVSKRNPYYKKRVNEVFYILIESILKSIYKNKENIYQLEISKLYPLFDILKFIEASFNKINQQFYLYSNELYSLRNLLSVYSIFQKEQDIKDILLNILDIINKDNEYLQNRDFMSLKDNILIIQKKISDKYGKDSDILADYMSNLLRQQYRKIDDQDYKYELLNFAFENDKLIQRSLYLLSKLLKFLFQF